MEKFVIEENVLKAYNGHDKIVFVPDGVTYIGGVSSDEDRRRRGLVGDLIGYRAFYHNPFVEEIHLPDSVEVIGFKSMEYAEKLKILSFSNSVKRIECNALLGTVTEKIIFRGTVYQFTQIDIDHWLDLNEVICSDGIIEFHKEYYIDVLNYPGTMESWRQNGEEWLKRRAKVVRCTDGDVLQERRGLQKYTRQYVLKNSEKDLKNIFDIRLMGFRDIAVSELNLEKSIRDALIRAVKAARSDPSDFPVTIDELANMKLEMLVNILNVGLSGTRKLLSAIDNCIGFKKNDNK